MRPQKVLALVGPTSSGKTPVSIRLAKKLDGEIVSADSRQVYKYLDIGTAKPSGEQRRQVRHHFVDMLEPTQEYSAGQYGREARETIAKILQSDRTPIVVGGSGLYIKAVIDGLFEGPEKDEEIRAQLESRMKTHGAESLLETLRKVDPEAAAKMDATKHRRIIRALEVYYITGKPLTELHKQQDSQPAFEVVQFGIQWKREELYARINNRVDKMIADGLIDEVQQLRKKGYDTRLNALNSVGYKEVFDYLDGTMNQETMVELIKRNTRRFAKRQLTWFRADRRVHWIQGEQRVVEDIAEEIGSLFTGAD
jgi:tRNA dimethylallyltransferase